jgi:hypothetical protein
VAGDLRFCQLEPGLDCLWVSSQTSGSLSQRIRIVKQIVALAAAMFFIIPALAETEDHAYLTFDSKDRLIVSGPFSVRIPKPKGARAAGPVHSNPRFMREQLRLSKAGYFVEDRFVVVEVETTNAGAGTISYDHLPTIELAGQDFHTRSACVGISQEELDAGDDPLLEFVQAQGFELRPAVYARQLLIATDDGGGEGVILYARRVNDCAEVTEAFEKEFDGQFDRFIQSIRDVNPKS